MTLKFSHNLNHCLHPSTAFISWPYGFYGTTKNARLSITLYILLKGISGREIIVLSIFGIDFVVTFRENKSVCRGGSRIFLRRGCTRLLLYFNTNKPHSFFLQNTSCIRKPQVISGGVRTPCTLPLDPPLVWLIMQRKGCKGWLAFNSNF